MNKKKEDEQNKQKETTTQNHLMIPPGSKGMQRIPSTEIDGSTKVSVWFDAFA